MENLTGLYNVFFNGRNIGEVHVSDDDMYVKFEMQCEIIGKEVYRLYCENKELFILIGVAIPERGKLRLIKNFTKNEMLRRGLRKIENCFIDTSEPEMFPQKKVQKNSAWEKIEDASSLFDDKDIADVCRELTAALKMEKDGITYLAISASPEEPFPLMPVFSFGEEESISGRQYIVFRIKNGKLY